MEEKKIPNIQEIKAGFKKNTIKMIIGLILIICCFCYLQKNPAEKISIVSSYKTIAQNIEIFFQNIFSDNGELLKQKYDLENYYEVMISLAEDKWCIKAEIINDLHDTYEKLLVEQKSNLKYSLWTYIEKEFEFDKILKQNCPLEGSAKEVNEAKPL